MSAAQLSDIELDRLLGEVPPPQPPSPDLADRIAARALRTPQERARRFAFAPRHRPRKHASLWTAVVAANLMAAAAAAASWDGQRFDFHRLADLPNRVAVAVHIGHHHREKALVAQRKVAPLAHIARAVRTASAIQPVEPSRTEPPNALAKRVVMPPLQVRPRWTVHPVERPHVIERQNAAAERHVRIRPFQDRVVVPAHRIARVRPNERTEQLVNVVPERSQLRSPEASSRQEYMEQRPAMAGRQPVAPEVAVSALPPERVDEQRQVRADRDAWQNEQYRRRLERWRNRWRQPEHPRGRVGRFRRRF